MSDFGLGDDIVNDEKLTAALRWHGLMEKDDIMKQKKKKQTKTDDIIARLKKKGGPSILKEPSEPDWLAEEVRKLREQIEAVMENTLDGGVVADRIVAKEEADMPLTQQQEQKFWTELNAKGIQIQCPFCHAQHDKQYQNLQCGELIEIPATASPGTVTMLQVICKNCGFVSLFKSDSGQQQGLAAALASVQGQSGGMLTPGFWLEGLSMSFPEGEELTRQVLAIIKMRLIPVDLIVFEQETEKQTAHSLVACMVLPRVGENIEHEGTKVQVTGIRDQFVIPPIPGTDFPIQKITLGGYKIE